VYLTPAQLAEIPGALELAQVASDDHGAVVDAELMELTLRGEDRSAYAADAIAAADAALVRIEAAIDQVALLIDGYLRLRYTLPLDPVPEILAGWARAIVRYRLHKDLHLEGDERRNPIVRDYRDALKFLAEVRDGRFSLGVSDPEIKPDRLDARFESDTKVFGRTELGKFR
jgi:phage gp36-like protein